MSKTHTNVPTICIPHPDLLDIVKKYLPGEDGIPVMYSITKIGPHGDGARSCTRQTLG